MRTYNLGKELMGLVAVCGFYCLMAGTAAAQSTWVEELGNFLAFYEATHPGSNWTPYNDELSRARDGLRAGDRLTVTRAMREFQKMLRMRAYGIDRAVADDLYNLTLTIRPSDDELLFGLEDLDLGRERSMSVPETPTTAPYKEKVRCHEGGCDYWSD